MAENLCIQFEIIQIKEINEQLLNGLSPIFNGSEVGSIAGVGTFVSFIIYGIWALSVINCDEENLLSSWGKKAGQGAAYLIFVVQAGSFFGFIPAGAFVAVFVLGGVVLYPLFVYSISNAFASKVN